MSRKILVLTTSGVCLVNADAEIWDRHHLTICKKNTLEDAITELKSDFHVLVIISMNQANAEEVHKNVKIFRTLTAAPISVVAEQPIDVALKIAVLNDGADHFATLPMTPEEAAAEIMVLIRRFTDPCSFAFQRAAYFYSHGLLIDIDRRMVLVGRIEIELKKFEFDILAMLAKGQGKVYTSNQIYEEVWKEDSVENAVGIVQSHICRLREQIQINPKQPNYIKTHYGSGYSFRPEYDNE